MKTCLMTIIEQIHTTRKINSTSIDRNLKNDCIKKMSSRCN